MNKLSAICDLLGITLSKWAERRGAVAYCQEADYCKISLEEALHVKDCVQQRIKEFSTGRYLARKALRKLGWKEEVVVGVGRFYEPLWPPGIQGSITHDDGVVAVCVRKGGLSGHGMIGIDVINVDKAASFGRDVRNVCLNQDDHEFFMKYCVNGIDYAFLVLSIKESIVKAISATVGDFVEIENIIIRYSPKKSIVEYYERRWVAEIYYQSYNGFILSMVDLSEEAS